MTERILWQYSDSLSTPPAPPVAVALSAHSDPQQVGHIYEPVSPRETAYRWCVQPVKCVTTLPTILTLSHPSFVCARKKPGEERADNTHHHISNSDILLSSSCCLSFLLPSSLPSITFHFLPECVTRPGASPSAAAPKVAGFSQICHNQDLPFPIMTVRLRTSPTPSNNAQVPPKTTAMASEHALPLFPASAESAGLSQPPSLAFSTAPVLGLDQTPPAFDEYPLDSKPSYYLLNGGTTVNAAGASAAAAFVGDKLFISPSQLPGIHTRRPSGSPFLTIDVDRANIRQNKALELPNIPEPLSRDTVSPEFSGDSSANSVRSVALQDAANLESSNSSSSINFDKLTQLPTPVINNGSFCLFPPEMSLVSRQRNSSQSPPLPSQTINIPKHPHNHLQQHLVPPELYMTTGTPKPRVYSEYRPTPLMRKNSYLDNINENSTRVASNPIKMVNKSPNNSSFMSSSPASVLSMSSYHGKESAPSLTDAIYQAPHLHTFYQFIEVLGSGNFSNVVLAVNPKDPEDLVVVKIISIPANDKTQISNFRSFIKRELNILNQVHHPSIITLLDYNINLSISTQEILNTGSEDSDTETDQDKVNTDMQNLKQNSQQFIFLNYCQGGNLFEFAKSKYGVHDLGYWLVVRRVVCELIFAVAYLHSMNIVHRDLKLENILLNYDANQLFNFAHLLNHPECTQAIIALTDFGLSKRLKSDDVKLSTRCGSQDYVSPELLMGLKYDGKLTDSWSLGVLIYALLENRLPFDALPVSASTPSTVSPSVLKRRRAKNKAAHRIAMIDWSWFKVEEILGDNSVDEQIKMIILELQLVVKRLLVRKEKRPRLKELIEDPEFAWFVSSVPPSMYETSSN